MLNYDHNPFSSFTSIVLIPATPVLADMLGVNIQYVNARPYQRSPLTAIGLVIGYKQHHGILFLKVQNATTCRERWINADTDFLAYVR